MNSMPTLPKNQTLLLRDRKHLEIDSVTDVVSFEETAVLLRTELGTVTVEGEGLHIVQLDLEKGRVVLDGRVNAILYIDKPAGGRGGFFSRMVR